MKINNLQLLELSLLLIIIINHLVINLPYITTTAILITLAIVIYGITFYDEAATESVSLDNIQQINPLDIHDDINLAPQELAQHVNYEVATINTEISRTNDIIKSAVLTMSDNFSRLKELSDNQNSIIENVMVNINNAAIELTNTCNQLNGFDLNTEQSITQDNPINSSGNNQITVLKDNIDLIITCILKIDSHAEQGTKDLGNISQQQTEAVSAGIRALQFEDLTNQILSSIKQNTQTIAELSNDVPILCSHVSKNDLINLTTLKQKLISMNIESKRRNNTKSIEQSSMEEGEVELF